MTVSPYADLPATAFWKPAIGERKLAEISGLWQPKFPISEKTRVATYGSCFAQHIGRALRDRGATWLQTEAPPYGMTEGKAKEFGYGLFTSRTGNIYTPTLLEQWGAWALGFRDVPHELWEEDTGVVDPFRPRIEPGGFANADEALHLRQVTLDAFRASIEQADVFVFTLGLTERWLNAREGYEYPMCPGTVAGTFDPELHVFDNLRIEAVISALERCIELFRGANPSLRFLLTVSPVPLTATASGQHVLVATMQSKAILRTAASEIVARMDHVDYFPSFEIVTNPTFGHRFFAENRRSVTPQGVGLVMNAFFEGQADGFAPVKPRAAKGAKGARQAAPKTPAEVVCEEEILESFGGDK